MKSLRVWVTAIAFSTAIYLLGGKVLAQLQTSAGAVFQGTSPWADNITQFAGAAVVTGTGVSGVGIPRVTVSNDSNVLATQSGTWTVQPGNTANTTPWLTTINQGGNSATVTAGGALNVTFAAGATVVSTPKTPCGTTLVNQAVSALPTVSTAVFASTTCLWTAYFNNTNASAQTITVTDNSGSPINAIGPSFSIPGLSNLLVSYEGVQFTSGVKWSAGGTGVTGAMYGYQ